MIRFGFWSAARKPRVCTNAATETGAFLAAAQDPGDFFRYASNGHLIGHSSHGGVLVARDRKQIEWALSALARLLRPVVRFALGMGLKHAQMEDLLRRSLIDEAKSLAESRGDSSSNISLLAVITGLHRKDLAKRLQEPLPPGLVRTEASASSRVFTRWLHHVSQDPSLWRLPLTDAGDGLSFESLAREETGGDVSHRVLLQDMDRLGVVRRHGRHVELSRDGFVPSKDLENLLAFLADNGRDHLLAGVHNVLHQSPDFLERAIFTQGLTLEECEQVQKAFRERWDGLQDEVFSSMVAAEKRSGPAGDHRIRIGVFAYFEPQRQRDEDA